MADIVIPWWPQKRQETLLQAAGVLDCLTQGAPPRRPLARAIGYGGAAGGGKTDGMVGLGLTWSAAYPGCSIGYFRRTFSELSGPDGPILRMLRLLAQLRVDGLATWNATEHRWTFAWGSLFTFCHAQHADDVHNYQSQAFDLLLVDEATHFTWPMVDYLMTRNRPTIDGLIAPLAVMCTNPGSVGHLWYKTQFFDTRPWERPHDVVLPSGESESRFFIQARLADNPILDRRADGQYRRDLERRDPITRKALLEGDFNIFIGQVFKEFDANRHVRPPRELPAHWPRWRAVDWGYANPCCCLWLCKDPDRGRVYVYREAYEVELTDRQQARLVRELTPPDEKIRQTLADPSMWTKKAHEERTFSTADEYAAEGVYLTKADSDRLVGKRKVHTLLADLPDGEPGLIIFETCPNLIRTLPALVYDQLKPEDVDSDGEDHAYDALRYGLTPVQPARYEKVKAAAPAEAARDRILAKVRQTGLRSRDL